MSSANIVILLGRVGQEPEVRTTAGGTKVVKLSVATDRQQKEKKTEWHRVTCFNKTAEIVEQYVQKGDRIHIQGRIEYSQSEKDGVTKYFTDIVADRVTLLGDRQAAPAHESNPFADTDDMPF